MKHLIPALILTIAAAATAPAASEKNVGLLLEWIQIDHKTANHLLHITAGESDATVLREVLEEEIDAGECRGVADGGHHIQVGPGEGALGWGRDSRRRAEPLAIGGVAAPP